MRRHVALLHSVVVAEALGGDGRPAGAGLGLGRPRTLLATGNLLFEAEAGPRALEAKLEPAFAARFGKHVDIIVREATAWPKLMAGNPFPEASEREPARVAVRVMRAPLDPGLAAAFERYLAEGDRLAVVGGDLWVHLPNGFGTSRLAAAITPSRAGGAGTFRNWNTVRKIGAALAD